MPPSRWGPSPRSVLSKGSEGLRRLALPAESLPEGLARAARVASEMGQERGKVPRSWEKPGRTWFHCWERLGTASPGASSGMGGTHEVWGLWMLATLKLAAGASGSGICEGNWGFLGGEVAFLALSHLRVNISATTDLHWGANEEWLGHIMLSWWGWAWDNTSERWGQLARDPRNEIRKGDKVPA